MKQVHLNIYFQSQKKKIIISKDIEDVVALMARIPTKSVNQSDKNNLKI